MTNLGALESFIDHDAVNYELDGKAESFTFPADAVLKFHVAVAAMKADGESRFDRLKIYELVPRFLAVSGMKGRPRSLVG